MGILEDKMIAFIISLIIYAISWLMLLFFYDIFMKNLTLFIVIYLVIFFTMIFKYKQQKEYIKFDKKFIKSLNISSYIFIAVFLYKTFFMN